MGFEEIVVGFDTRVPFHEIAPAWDEERRHTFLLRFDVAYPVSVDEAVWPRRGSGLTPESFEVKTPRFATLEAALADAAPDEVVVALTVWHGPGEPDPGPTIAGGPPDPRWRRLGWDVVDGVFPSGISNCGYPAEEILDWRDGWASRFNEVHLFDDLPTAFAYRDRTNQRVTEHAPFSVCGLYVPGR